MTRLRHLRRHSFHPYDEGSSVIEVALLLPVLLLLLVGAVDLGRGYYTAIEVASAAEAAALYGSLGLTDTAGMQAAAQLDARDVHGLTAVATYGCECSDGSSASPSCATVPSCGSNAVEYVQVNTTAVYTPLLHFGSLGAAYTLRGQATMRVGNGN